MKVKNFNKLPKNKKAILVVKDVLEQIRIGRYIPTNGRYLDDQLMKISSSEDIQSNFEKINNCEACALGTMLLSCTHLGNKLTFGDIKMRNLGGNNSNKIKEFFLSIFDAKQLLLIETAFESYSGYLPEADDENYDFIYNEIYTKYGSDILGEKLTREECNDCNEFYLKYSEDKERLIAICNNIINNNGIFLPSEL